MFCSRYFAPRYFAPRYWARAAAVETPAVTPVAADTSQGSGMFVSYRPYQPKQLSSLEKSIRLNDQDFLDFALILSKIL